MDPKALHWPEYLAEAGLLGLFMVITHSRSFLDHDLNT